ncbi:oligosaccharide flippase family protein [Haloterrigena salifodinae]|uniref:Oligosaccharide flippase family protein n=1 Tax=Haloterrigena salifodinae TaxID=2675099 RepID=A0A8T8DWN5_9EURY|nr:oligosaccharide flippase family protein [Haloterrigena salifodinae]QRV13994.1 oligosaccharide flippase family protein [Haloterrigena salifodinae]
MTSDGETQADAGNINLSIESLKGLTAQFTQAAIGFAGTILFARLLGPASFGGFYFLLSVVTISTRPIDGFGNAVRKRFSEHDAPREELIGSVFSFNAASFVIAVVSVWAFRDLITGQTNVENGATVFLLLSVSIGWFLPIQKLIGGAGYPAFQIWNDTLRSVLTLPLQLAFVLTGAGAAGMGYGLAGATLLTIPVGLFVIRVRPAIPSQETLKSIWSFARYSAPTALLGAAYGRFDVIVLGTLLTTAAVGYYEVAYRLTVPATFMTTALATALMPKISNLHSRGEAIATDITNAIAYNSIFAIPLFFGAVALSREIIVTIYGGEYANAATFLIGLALYQVFATQTSIYQRTISGIDRPDLELQIDTITLVFNVVSGILLIFIVGSIGVVIATIFAEFIRLVLSARSVRALIPNIESVPRPLIEQVGASMVMFVGVEVGQSVLRVQSWIDLGALVGLGVLLYGGVLLGISNHVRNTLLLLCEDIIS